jgi:hypothetical protein
MGKGVMGMDDGLSDLADISQLGGNLTHEHVVQLQEVSATVPLQTVTVRIVSILVSLSNNIPTAP